MAKLSESIKVHIVTCLACFDTTRAVVADVKERFGVAVSHQQVSSYDPSTVNGQRLSQDLRKVFDSAREKFLGDVTGIPIANSTVRLRALDRMARTAEERGNMKMAAALIEQAAKEAGGMYTNRREYSGPNGGPIPIARTPELTPAERAEIVARALAEF